MQGQDLLRFLRILGRWWWVVALVLLATIGALTTAITLAKPQYQAGVTIQISAPPPQEVPLFSEYGREAISQQIEQTRSSLAEFLQAGDVAKRVLDRLPNITMSEEALRTRISVELPTASQTIRVRVQADSPATAALLANTVAEAGLAYYAQLLAQPTAKNREFVEQQLQLAAQKLVDAEAKLEQFRLEHKVYDVEKAIDEQSSLLTRLRENRDLARAQNAEADVQQITPLITEREAELQALIQLVPGYNLLVDQVEHIRSTSNLLQESLSEAQIKESQILSSGSIQLISAARPPADPLPALSNGVILLSVGSSLMVGMLLALLLEFMDSLTLARRGQAYRVPPEVVIKPAAKGH